jgi:hypothetical protein
MSNTNLSRFNEIYRLVVEPVSGAELYAVAKQTYDLQEEVRIPTLLRHNDTLYRVSLDVTKLEPPGPCR